MRHRPDPHLQRDPAAPLPLVNALAAIMVYFTVTALGLTYLFYRFMTRHERPKGGGARLR